MKHLFTSVIALLVTFAVAAQPGAQQIPVIPADKAVRVGTLPNGMKYYLRHNDKQKNLADFYISHDVGAIQEEDDQQGLAHFLEHMAFNGTKNLPGKMLIEYLETVGVKFGTNLNAGTSWDYTQYLLKDVPTIRPGIVDTAMLILHDWSHFIALQPKEIDSERGVIMEELRMRDDASWRGTIKMLQALGKGTRYEHRNLIGHLDGLKSFSHTSLENFYKKWYRPELQAVVIVGDINVDEIEAKLQKLMADIPASLAGAAQKEHIVVPNNQEPIISMFEDPEMQQTKATLFIKHEALPKNLKNTILAEQLALINALADEMASDRLQEIAMKPNAPFTGASFVNGGIGICQTLECTGVAVMTQDGKILEGYKALLTEMERMRRHGFTEGEWERAKNNILSSLESQYNSREDRRHSYFANRYIDNFRMGTPIYDFDTEYQLDKQLVEMISCEMVNATIKQLYEPLKNVVIVANSPVKDGVAIPTEAELVGALKAAVAADVEPFKDNVVKEPLISDESALKGSKVVKSVKDESLGFTEWTLANGIKVVIKQTPYQADNIGVEAISDGGAAVFANDMYYSAQMLGGVMSMSGISKFSASDLRKQLSGKTASAGLGVSSYEHVVTASAALKDVETMFQLLYLQFTAPRFSEDDFTTLMNRYNSMLANQTSNPDFIFSQNVQKSLYSDNYRRQQLTPELLQTIKLEHMPAIHKRLYSNAADFRFTFIGNMSEEQLKPYVEKYIGSLPTA